MIQLGMLEHALGYVSLDLEWLHVEDKLLCILICTYDDSHFFLASVYVILFVSL